MLKNGLARTDMATVRNMLKIYWMENTEHIRWGKLGTKYMIGTMKIALKSFSLFLQPKGIAITSILGICIGGLCLPGQLPITWEIQKQGMVIITVNMVWLLV